MKLRGLLLLVGMVCAGTAQGAVIVSDPFTDGDRANGLDPLDVAWFTASSNTTLTVNAQAESAITGNGLFVNSGNAFRSILAHMPEQELANVGDRLKLSFDFRFFTSGTTATSTNPAAQTAATGFRVGLFSSSISTLTAADNTPAASNAYFGYRGEIMVGGSGSATPGILSEIGGDPIILTGADSTSLTGVTGTQTRIADLNAHSASFELERTATGILVTQTLYSGIGLSGTILGTTTATDSGAVNNTNSHTGIYTRFDVITFGMGSVNFNYRLDNIQVEFTAIPEPSTLAWGLAALTAAGLLRRKARRRADHSARSSS